MFHINYVKGKVAKGIGILYKARRLLKEDTLLTLYYSFIYPYFHYCIEVWGNTYKSYLDSLVKLQKNAIRYITFSHYLAHTDPLFSKLKVLKLSEIYSYCVSLFMYKYQRKLLPTVFDDMFICNRDVNFYVTRQSDELFVPAYKNLMSKRSVRYNGTYIWNKVSKLGFDCSFWVFKRKVKFYLYEHGAITR